MMSGSGLHIKHQPHWHTYWINPGDSGLAIKLVWHLPPGFEAHEIQWPAPQRFVVDGLNNFGYDGDVLLPVQLHVATTAKAGDISEFSVDAKWLVCSDECVPGKATLKPCCRPNSDSRKSMQPIPDCFARRAA